MTIGDRVELVGRGGAVEEGEIVLVARLNVAVRTLSGTWTVPADGSRARSGYALRVLSEEERAARARRAEALTEAEQALGALGLRLPGAAKGWSTLHLRGVAAAAVALREALS